MTSEFSDELLSAYLDDELSPGERATVDAELASNPQARQLLDELRSLSTQVQSLPTFAPSSGFTERVVQAALAVQATPGAAVEVSPKPAVRRGKLSAVLGGVAAVAASIALLIWYGGNASVGPDGNLTVTVPTDPSAVDLALARLRMAAPQEGEAIVIRVRIAPNQSPAEALDAALAAAGIAQAPGSDSSTLAMQVAKSYRDKLLEKFGGQQPGVPNAALNDGTLAAADAVFVEASWASLEQTVATLAGLSGPEQQPFDISPLMSVAAAAIAGEAAIAEGEPGSAQQVAPSTRPKQFAQRLNPRLFRLEKAGGKPEENAAQAAAPAVDAERLVRVLLLVEPIAATQSPQ